MNDSKIAFRANERIPLGEAEPAGVLSSVMRAINDDSDRRHAVEKRLSRNVANEDIGTDIDKAIAHRDDLLKCALDTGKAWGPKELFGWFWKSRDKYWAKANFTFWYEQVKKSGPKHMIKVAETLRKHLYGEGGGIVSSSSTTANLYEG